MTAVDPLQALSEVIVQYLAQCGVSSIALDIVGEGDDIDVEIEDAVEASCLMPLFGVTGRLIYEAAGLAVAAPVWPIKLAPSSRGLLGLEARWEVSEGAAPWGMVYPAVMSAVHDLLTRDDEDPRLAVISPSVLRHVIAVLGGERAAA